MLSQEVRILNKSYDTETILKYAMEHGMLDLSDVTARLDMDRNNKFLSMHPYDIYRGKDGNWYTYLPNGTSKQRKRIRRQTRKQIEQAVAEFYRQQEEDPTITVLFTQWNDQRFADGEIQPNSHSKYANDFKRFFLPSDQICMVPFSQIEEADIERCIKVNIHRYELTRKGYASLRTLIIGIWKYAKMRKLTDISISTFFKDLSLSRNLFKKNKKKDQDDVFNDDESALLADYFRQHPTIHNLGLLLMFETGVRIGELCVLQASDITEDGIFIHRTEQYYKNDYNKTVFSIKESAKGDSEDRLVVIPPQAIDTLRRIRRLNPFGEFLFMKNGKRINSTRFNYWLYKACDEVGIPRRSTHKCRKTYASLLIDGGVDKAITKNQMGHSTFRTTDEYYHRSTKTKAEVKKQISAAVSL